MKEYDFYIGLGLIILSLFWFYYIFNNSPSKKDTFRSYSIQRDIMGGLTLFIFGLLMMLG